MIKLTITIYVKQNMIVNFTIQNLKNKHSLLCEESVLIFQFLNGKI